MRAIQIKKNNNEGILSTLPPNRIDYLFYSVTWKGISSIIGLIYLLN